MGISPAIVNKMVRGIIKTSGTFFVMVKNKLITLISLGFILSVAVIMVAWGGYHLWRDFLYPSEVLAEVLGVTLNQKNMANLSVFILMPFAFGGMLMAVYHFSVDLAMRILSRSSLLVTVIGSVLYYMAVLTIVIFLTSR